MALLGGRGPFYGRLPIDSPHTKTVAAITMDFESIVDLGGTENQIVTLHIWGFNKMLLENVSKSIDRLFHDYRFRWVPLAVTGGISVAFTRVDFRVDVVDAASELYHKVCRIRVRYAHSPTPG